MPSTIAVTREQLEVLTDQDADVTLLELPHVQGEIEAWVNPEDAPARSIIVAMDGEILSDLVLEDTMQ